MPDNPFPRSIAPADSVPAGMEDREADVVEFNDFRPRSPQKVAVVTGGSSGIGAAIVKDLARDHVVIAVGRDWARLNAVAQLAEEMHGGSAAGTGNSAAAAGPARVIPVIADLEEPDSLEAVFDEEVRPFGRLDVLVHNAAVARRRTVEDASIEDWRESLATNVVGPAELTRVLLPWLRIAKGTVVFIGSGASRTSVPFHTVYSAAKHAVQAVADGLRQQVSADGVRVSTVAPGPTHTPMNDLEHPYPVQEREVRLEPESVARSVRHVVDAPAEASVSELWVRPRE
ncbi:SDR family NAD(P)-dependent oxidoreductase [Brevibacterium sp.]|uniref:SDR family NAD(P)-dependent oxidoreductase n=1 Tax=Brevibacterium sp. TaxID=1701 RepID=UPI0025C248F3|nr:SDR family NAD(P)-dependent oxidoreductase [Brevibacterium sp.]